jgi:hypothetical protein
MSCLNIYSKLQVCRKKFKKMQKLFSFFRHDIPLCTPLFTLNGLARSNCFVSR